MFPDLFGKIEELENEQSAENEVFQISESSLLDTKTGRIYFTDEIGRTGTLVFTNGGRIINDLLYHDQVDTAIDVINLMFDMEFDLVEN